MLNSSIWPIEWTWEQWQLRGTPPSPKLQNYWSLTIRLFSVISRALVARGCWVLPLWRDAFSVFYSPSRRGVVSHGFIFAHGPINYELFSNWSTWFKQTLSPWVSGPGSNDSEGVLCSTQIFRILNQMKFNVIPRYSLSWAVGVVLLLRMSYTVRMGSSKGINVQIMDFSGMWKNQQTIGDTKNRSATERSRW